MSVIDRYHDDELHALRDAASVGRAIAQQRAALRISQEQLALSIGVNRRVVGELERGKETVQLGIALRALEAVGLRLTATVPR